MTSTPRCQQCGDPVAVGARFCARCGADVSGQQAQIATAQLPSGSPTPVSISRELDSVPRMTDLLPLLRKATLGEYEVLRELGRGGMAAVFLAHDIALDRKVAIKVMSPMMLYGEGMAERFKREAKTAAALSHAHIIPIYAVRQQGDLLYFIMKCVEGRGLDAVIRDAGRLPIATVQTILEQVGGALQYAHRRGVVHRDIKPANIMLDEEGGAVVTDFGIAKVAKAEGLTMTGATVGTPAYMSPEQCSGSEVTGQSDQYSLGIVAYEMLAGKLPFHSDSLMGMMLAHFNETPPPMLQARPDCPPALAAAVERMLAKQPEDRFPSVQEAVAAITRVRVGSPEETRANLIALATSNLAAGRTDSTAPTSPVPPGRPRPPAKAPRPAPTARPGWVGPAVIGGVGVVVVATALLLRFSVSGTGPIDGGDSTARVGPPPPAPALLPVAAVVLHPAQTTLTFGDSAILRAELSDSLGVTLTGRGVAWSSTNAAVARVDSGGKVLAISAGTAEIRAASEGRQGSATVTVTARAVRLIGLALSPPETTVTAGTGFTPRTQLTGEGGVTLSGRTIDWRSSDPRVLRVDGVTGRVQALKAGRAELTATADGVDGRSRVLVMAARVPVTALRMPAPRPMAPGDTATLTATPLDDRDAPLTDRVVVWGSDNPDVAAIDPTTGRVTARMPGVASLRATADSVTRVVQLTVRVLAPAVAAPTGPVAGPDTTPAAPAAATLAVEEIAAGGSVTCGLGTEGNAFCWGGEAGAPAALGGGPYRKLVAGDGHRCALTVSGEAWCWGANAEGQLGNGSTRDSPTPLRVDTRQSFEDLSAGASHTCALTRDGAAWCWGNNRDGQLGDGSQNRRTKPVLVQRNLSYRSISAGGRHTCGVTTANKAYCWGDGFSGQLGNSRTQRQTEPNEVVSGTLQFRVIAVGDLHSCALTTTSRIYCWGENKNGQLGIDSRDSRPEPLDSVSSDLPFKDLAAGRAHSCGLTTRNQLLCWGDNSNGQLGDGSKQSRVVPTAVAGNRTFSQVRAGGFHTCALSVAKQPFCWGANSKGQVGAEGGAFVLTPAAVRPPAKGPP